MKDEKQISIYYTVSYYNNRSVIYSDKFVCTDMDLAGK